VTAAPGRLPAVLRAVAVVTYKEWAAYRSHMLLSLLIGPAYFLAQGFIWRALFAGREELGGFDLPEMLRYYGTAAVIYYLTMDFADWNLQMLVRTGRFLTFALRPVDHRTFALAQKLGHRSLGIVFEFLPVWLIFTFAFGVRLWPARPLWALLSVALAFLMMFLVNYAVGLLAFWLTRTDGIRAMVRFTRDLLAGTLVPLTLFPAAAQKVMLFLPFQFIAYAPVRVFLGRYELGGVALSIPAVVGCQAAAVAVMWLLTGVLYRLGIRRYTGVGA
jgi:viologen exporter family transport system permease protein